MEINKQAALVSTVKTPVFQAGFVSSNLACRTFFMEQIMETYKLIFAPETTQQEATTILSRYIDKLVMHNFRQNVAIGGNKVSYAVVDLPQDVVQTIVNTNVAKVDGMQSSRCLPSGAECADC